jgi:hypothetical protein
VHWDLLPFPRGKRAQSILSVRKLKVLRMKNENYSSEAFYGLRILSF